MTPIWWAPGRYWRRPEAANPDDPAEEVERAPAQDGVPLVVVDGRGRVKCWGMLQSSGYWSGFVSLATEATPVEHVAYLRRRGVEVVVAGSEKVDLAVALQELATRFGVASVRVDSGGTLNGALMRAGLVDELALLVHPAVVASTSPNPLFRLEGQDITLALRSPEVEGIRGRNALAALRGCELTARPREPTAQHLPSATRMVTCGHNRRSAGTCASALTLVKQLTSV